MNQNHNAEFWGPYIRFVTPNMARISCPQVLLAARTFLRTAFCLSCPPAIHLEEGRNANIGPQFGYDAAQWSRGSGLRQENSPGSCRSTEVKVCEIQLRCCTQHLSLLHTQASSSTLRRVVGVSRLPRSSYTVGTIFIHLVVGDSYICVTVLRRLLDTS